ncbi:uncharacterized protein K441DRAFT_516573, partial [Cenococcum geophilum 1.58]|uniref:uncharacterized protein n=1 Tax=Cenococcum geophilum 1.58 TaxID=794803 RepID=UPI00358E4C19
FVTRHPEEKYLPECCVAKFKNYSSWMAWGIITRKWKGPVVFFEKEWGRVSSLVYLERIVPVIAAF